MQAYTTDVCAHLQIGNSNLLECKSAHVTRAFFIIILTVCTCEHLLSR